MFRLPMSRKSRLRREARAFADRGLHRAEELRAALPEASDVLSDLREQALPVMEAARPMVEAARGQAARAQAARGKTQRSSRRRPLLIAALIAIGAVVAFYLFSRRDKEPAFLMPTPDEPITPAADDPEPGGIAETPPAPVADQTTERSWTTPSSARVEEPVVAPTAASAPTSSTMSQAAGQSADGARPGLNGSYGGGYQPRAQAAWDLPPSGNSSAPR